MNVDYACQFGNRKVLRKYSYGIMLLAILKFVDIHAVFSHYIFTFKDRFFNELLKLKITFVVLLDL